MAIIEVEITKDKIVLDLETQKTFSEVGRSNLHLMRISIAGIYSYCRNDFLFFTENNILSLLPLLEDSSIIIGFNIKNFDYQVLRPYFNRDIANLPTLDILEEVRVALGYRLKLQDLVTTTLGETKLGNGLDAIRYFRNGEIDKLKKYCQHDIYLTRSLYEYGRKYGQIYYQGRFSKQAIPVRWS